MSQPLVFAAAMDATDLAYAGAARQAQLIASAFLKDGPIVTTRGRAVKEQTLRATGDPVISPPVSSRHRNWPPCASTV